MTEAELKNRVDRYFEALAELVASPFVPFCDLTPSRLPDEPGVYCITDGEGVVLRAGRTIRQSLRDRLYRNHLMGTQPGNLGAQLVRAGVGSRQTIRGWIRANCHCQFLTRSRLSQLGVQVNWLEYFMLAILQPRFCD